MTENGQPTLIYFDMRGRAEATRLLFIDQGIAFVDRRIRSVDSWQSLKRTLPLGGLPLYKDPLINLTQSHAILRYLARSTGMMPADPVRQSAFDLAQEALAEVQEQLWQFAWTQEYRSDPDSFGNGQLTRALRGLERLFLTNSSEFWVGDAASHVDYLGFALFSELQAFFPAVLAKFDVLTQFLEAFGVRPRVQAYSGSRKQPAVFGMGLHGPKIDPLATLSEGDVFENPWTKPIPLRRG